MGSRKKATQKSRQAELARRRKSRLRNPEGWQPRPPAEAALLDVAPVAAPHEPAEDQAVFDADVGLRLAADLQAEAALVREALDLTARGEPHAALDRLAGIGRKSPYAEWRLFVRGLVAFQRGDRAAAHEAWHRLEPGRRPARIAAVLGRAWDEVTAGPPAADEPAAHGEHSAAVQAAIGLIRRASMWTAAREIAAVQHRDEQRTFSASQAALTIRLEKQYRGLDPDFVNEFSSACRALALRQPDEEPLLALCRSTAGPPDDPRNTRLQLIHLRRFMEADEAVRQHAREYVDRDLPGLTHLPEPLRAALASVTLERAATHLLDQADGSFLSELTPQEEQVGERLLRESVERFARNRRAHEALIELLASRAKENGADGDAGRALLNAKLAFVGQFPDQYGHVRDLVDRFIAAGDFARAEPLVQTIANQRTGDTTAKAMPWRFELLKAASCAASGSGLPQARAALEAAIAAWPSWMNRLWIPFLEAALLLREGNEAGFAAALDAARRGAPDDLAADVMLHEAFVRLKCPAHQIEPIRTRLRRAAKEVGIDSAIVQLANAACFFMELERSGLTLGGDDHPAFALGRALGMRLGGDGRWSLGRLTGQDGGLPVDDPGFWAAFRWLATHDFFGTVKPRREPKGIARLADSQPRAAAEVLEWLTRTAPDSLTTRKSGKRLALVEKALATEPNPAVVQRLTEIVTAARKAVAEAEGRKRRARFLGGTRGFPPLEDFHAAGDMPPFLHVILNRGGPAALAEIIPLLMGPRNEKTAQRIAQIAARLGISKAEMIDLLGP